MLYTRSGKTIINSWIATRGSLIFGAEFTSRSECTECEI